VRVITVTIVIDFPKFQGFCLYLLLCPPYNYVAVDLLYICPYWTLPTKMLKHRSFQWLAISCIAVIITGCGGGGGSGGSSSNTNSQPSTPSASPTPASTPAPTPNDEHNVHISWAAPTTRADGSALPASALAGYRLFYTRDDSSANEDAVVAIDGGSITSTDLSLHIGTYTFAITAIDGEGIESSLSAPVSISID
jgi:hypothetical protein